MGLGVQVGLGGAGGFEGGADWFEGVQVGLAGGFEGVQVGLRGCRWV